MLALLLSSDDVRQQGRKDPRKEQGVSVLCPLLLSGGGLCHVLLWDHRNSESQNC